MSDTKIACQYVIVRFAPFVETEEFANVGILMMAPNARYYDFQLETRRYGRITKFFEGLDPKLYKNALKTLKAELERIHELLNANGFDVRYKSNDVEFAQQLFQEVTRTRETIIRFSKPRVVMAQDPKATLKELFGYYVERNFVTKEYAETRLEKGIRQWLYQVRIGDNFQKLAIGDDLYQATFPFVEQVENKPFKLIKPLHLAHDKPSKILEHGGQWLFKLQELKRRQALPEKVMFAMEGPTNHNGQCQEAFEEISGRIEQTGIEVVPYAAKEQIIEFAQMH